MSKEICKKHSTDKIMIGRKFYCYDCVMERLQPPLVDLKADLDEGSELEAALLAVKLNHNLSRIDILLMGFVYEGFIY